MRRRLLAAATILVLALAGCSAAPDAGAGAGTAAAADALLAAHGLAGLSGLEVVDALEAVPTAERATDFTASVRPGELLLTDSAGAESSVDLPDDLFYLAVAPYVDGTHDCFYHSLTTCHGELGGQRLHVTVTGDDGTVLVDEDATAHDDGFVAYWLPRGSSGTVAVTYGDRTGSYGFATDDDAPTCVTTLQLA